MERYALDKDCEYEFIELDLKNIPNVKSWGLKPEGEQKMEISKKGDVFYTTDSGVQPLRELRDEYDMEFILPRVSDYEVYHIFGESTDKPENPKVMRFVNCDLSNLHIQYRHLINTEFIDCNFHGTDFYGSVIENCIFRNSNLIDASFKSSKIDNSAFNDCDMPVTLFENSNITDCDFSSSLLVGANFDFSTIRRVNMNDVYLKRATFRYAAIKAMLVDDCKLESANFAGAEIDNEQLHLFSRASEANLSDANIKK